MHIELKLGRFQAKKMKGSIPAGLGENQQSVTDEPVEFEKQPAEIEDFRTITDHFRGIYGRICLK